MSRQTFRQLLHFIYTDSVGDDVTPSTCLKLVELANRLCLPRLVALVEEKISGDLEKLSEVSPEAAEVALTLLEPCQVRNTLIAQSS